MHFTLVIEDSMLAVDGVQKTPAFVQLIAPTARRLGGSSNAGQSYLFECDLVGVVQSPLRVGNEKDF